MTEVMSKNQDLTNIRFLHGPGAQKNCRTRFGQNRASKRSIVDYKRTSHRNHKGQKGDTTKVERSLSSEQVPNKTDCHKSKDRPVHLSHAPTTTADAESESISPIDLQTPLTEHKRARPELQLAHSKLLCDLSSSAPPDYMRENSAVLEDSPSTQTRQFTCKPSDVDEHRLQYLLSREAHYHPNNAFLYYVNPEVEDKVDAALRNEAVHNLRFMHNAFFNLSTETFCKAVNLIDRFIVKVKVKPKYMACVATASYCVASKLCHSDKDTELPDLDTLVQLTRCGGNAADLVRMEEILASKLSQDLDGVNSFDFLQLFVNTVMVATPNRSVGAFVSPDSIQTTEDDKDNVSNNKSKETERTQLVKRLMTRLEITLCSLEAYRFRPACLALGIMAEMNVKGLAPLADMCGLDWSDVLNCASLIEELYEIYYRDPLPCPRRPLVWNLSRRTLLRIGYSCPTPLDTITEDSEPVDEDEWLLPLLFEP